MARKSIAFGLATATLTALTVCTYSTSSAEAASVHWNLNNVRFDDNGFAYGSFDYDPAQNTYSNWDITTTPSLNIPPANGYSGNQYTPATYSLGAGSSATNLILSNFTLPAPFSVLSLTFGGTGLSSDAPNQIVPIVASASFEASVLALRSVATPPPAAVYNSSVAAIPTPALLPGLIGLGVAAWRKKRTAAKQSAGQSV